MGVGRRSSALTLSNTAHELFGGTRLAALAHQERCWGRETRRLCSIVERVKAGLVVAPLTSVPRIHTDQQRSIALLGQRERITAGASAAATP